MNKTFEAALGLMVCSHSHPTKKEAEECRDKWIACLKEKPYGIAGRLGSAFDYVTPNDGFFHVREKRPHGKQQLWCRSCAKYIPWVRWSGHNSRHHGINSPEKRPHQSHKMTKWRSEIRCPASTERFYNVRECKRCGLEEMYHPAGHFNDGLREPCLETT